MTWNAEDVWVASQRFPGTCSRCGQPEANHFDLPRFCFEPPKPEPVREQLARIYAGMTIPSPVSSWVKDSFMGEKPPTIEQVQESADTGRHARLRGWKYNGPGWYPVTKVLVIPAGEGRIILHFYDRDPRPGFQDLADLPEGQ